MIKSTKWIPLLVTASLTSCGDLSMLQQTEEEAMEDSSESEGVVLKREAPSDSTGAKAKVELQFLSATAAAALRLVDVESVASPSPTPSPSADTAAAAGIVVGDVTINLARFNVAAIKLKSKKELSAEEVKAQEAELKEETVVEDKIDEIAGEAPVVVEPEEKDDYLATMPVEDAAMLAGGMRAPMRPRQPETPTSKPKDRIEGGKERGEKIEARQDELKTQMKGALEKLAKRDESVGFFGPAVFDAVAGKFEGEGINIETEDGTYRRIEFKLKRNFGLEAEDPLLGNVFVVKGEVKLGEQQVPFEMNWHRALNFRLVSADGVSVSAGTDAAVAIVFDLHKWFDGVDFSKARVAADGKIYIDRRANHEIRRQISKNMKRNMRFGLDKNQDASLGASETAGAGEAVDDPAEPEAVSSETGEVVSSDK
jgi:hypothetical protein